MLYPIRSLPHSNQLELLLTQRVSLIIFKRDWYWSRFNHEKFILDYFSVDWLHTLKLQNNNIDASFQSFFDSMNNTPDKHAPFKKITKYKLKFKTKPWIITAYRNLFLLKIKVLKIVLKRKIYIRKMNFIVIIKSTEISSLQDEDKISKQNYYYSKVFSKQLNQYQKHVERHHL